MLLYDLTFPSKEICDEAELYLRGGEVRNDGVYIKDGEIVSFDTYFNCFSHIKYKKYTKIKEVALKLELQGCAKASVCLYRDGEEDIVIKEQKIENIAEICVNIEKLPEKGFLYFKLQAENECVLESGGWYADVDKSDVKIGIVICTFKREQFLRRNLNNLTAYMRTLDNRFFDVFVVDNGRTVTDDFGDGVKVIPNENTGGSGGFTRGMKEVCKGGYTHILLMDDDILFDVKTLYRTYVMLCILKEEYKDASVGGAMLILDRPYFQEEMGANWTGLTKEPINAQLDARKVETICVNEAVEEPDYNAWFFMCMPVSAPEKHGYPLPFFIRGDDMEYGLRACDNIITTSGISVWHDGFDLKYSPEIEYYIKRNEMIVSARYPRGKHAFANWKKLVFAVGKQLMLQRYFAVDLIFKAYDDFFKGADNFLKIDSAQLHTELRKCGPEFLTAEEIRQKYGIKIDFNQMQTHKKWGIFNYLTLNGYLIPKCFYQKTMAQVDMTGCEFQDLALKRRVLHFNSVTGKGFVTEIKKSELFKAWGKLIKYFFIMMFKYRKTAKAYAKI